MLYLAMISNSFRKSSIAELSRAGRFSIVEERASTLIIESEEADMVGKLERQTPIFIYLLLPLPHVSSISKEDYLGSIITAGLSAARKGLKIRAECYDVNSKEGYSAKDIEVRLGRRMESEGYEISLEQPDALLYLVLINGTCYSGCMDKQMLKRDFINPERHYHRYSRNAISRAELKLIQAFDEFSISASGIAIDLGAAPGGWSKFLAEKGLCVIAVDKGSLDYRKLEENSIKAREETLPYVHNPNEPAGIIHLRARAEDASGQCKLSADLMVNDMNLSPANSAALALSMAGLLKPGSQMVMTVKCIDRKAERHLQTVEKALAPIFRIERKAVLPSNRQEITILATYAGQMHPTL